MRSHQWRVELLGGIAAERGSTRLSKFSTKQTAGLLALLAFACPVPVPRDEAAAKLWGEGERQMLRNRLSQAISTLRRLLGNEDGTLFTSSHHALSIKPGVVAVDVHEFEATIEQMDQAGDEDAKLELANHASALYKGDYLAGYSFLWAEADRSRLKSKFLHALDVAIASHEGAGRIQRAVDVAFRRLHAEPSDPGSLLKLCRLLLQYGRPSQVAQLINAHEAGLTAGTALDPALDALRAEAGAVPQAVGTAAVAADVSLGTIRPVKGPSFTTPIIGRDAELAEVHRLFIESDSKLLTVTGLGGAGKTRFAVAFAERFAASGAGWAAFVHAGSFPPAPTLLGAIGTALGLGDDADLGAIRAALPTHPPGLIVVDEAEHLDAKQSGVLVQFLAAVPHVRILVTSRTPLRLAGESVYPLSPLRTTRRKDEAVSPAAALFFLFSEKSPKNRELDAEAVQALCEQVDGLPLSIELAAGWVRVLSANEIVERLKHESVLLQDASVPPASRHSSLQHVVVSTIELASDSARNLVLRAAAFEGPVCPSTLEAAAGPGSPQALRELEALGILQYAGLAGERTMVMMLSSVRRIVRERWSKEEKEESLDAHRKAMLDAALPAEARERSEEGQWMAETEAQLADHATAIRRSLSQGLGEDAVRHAIVVSKLGETGTSTLQCVELLEATLAIEGISPESRLRGSVLLARMLWMVSQYDKSKALAEEQLQVARRQGDAGAEVGAMSVLQVEAHRIGDFATSESLLQASLESSVSRSDHSDAARCWLGLGNLAMERMHWKEAETAYARSLEAAEKAGARNRKAAANVNLAFLAFATQRHLAAVEFAQRALAIAGESPAFSRLAAAAHAIATQAHATLGDSPAALQSLGRGLEFQPQSNRELVGLLTAAAAASVVSERARLGAQLLGFIDAVIARGENPGGLEGANRAAITAQCVSELGKNGFESLYMAGGTLGKEQALEIAKQVAQNGTACVV
ncbi:MAG: hypothetical protein AB7F50_06700 [Fimbriimonadaceae bacterium]